MQIFLATSNVHKVQEFRKILHPYGITVCKVDLNIPEVRSERTDVVALEKARYASNVTGKTVVAEDSGLYIDALNGFPGTYSAFVFKKIGLQGILKLMKGVKDRKAREMCAVALCSPGGKPKVFVGVSEGRISERALGNKGFGYDPIFIPKGRNHTYAEEYGVKHLISHRAHALKKLAKYLKKESLRNAKEH